MIIKEAPSSRFLLVGEHCNPKEMREVYNFIRNHELASFIELPGIIVGRDKEKILLNSDIFVFTPITPEGQPLVILEAMAAGLPVISTCQGAIPDMLIDGINGFIVRPEDPAAIAEKVNLLLKDEPLRIKMGRSSREIFLERFTLDRWCKDMNNMFLQVSRE